MLMFATYRRFRLYCWWSFDTPPAGLVPLPVFMNGLMLAQHRYSGDTLQGRCGQALPGWLTVAAEVEANLRAAFHASMSAGS